MQPIIQVTNLTKIFTDKIHHHQIKAVDQLNFSIHPQQKVGIIGESGSGKTTLLNLLVALDQADDGAIEIDQKSLSDWLKHRKALRRKIQMIYQNPYEVFDRRQTIQEILMQPLRIHQIGNSQKERLAIIDQALADSGFTPTDHYLSRYPHELSGGQLQRISILRSLLIRPDIIVADEPVSMLDVSIRASVLEMLLDAHQAQQNTMIIVSHDILSLRNIVDRLFIMYHGQIIEDIPAHQLLTEARHPYTQVLISNAHGKEVTNEALDRMIHAFNQNYGQHESTEMIEISPNHYLNCSVE